MDNVIYWQNGGMSMAKLKYTLMNDTLFKMLFVKYPDLLKRLVAELLYIDYDSINELVIINPEMPPESMGDKFCRLDINMTVDGRRVNLEIQVENEGNYPERSLFHWAREYSTALVESDNYKSIPCTIVISIINFRLFGCLEFHSEYQIMEVKRHTVLTNRFNMHYFELPKLPALVDEANTLELWLTLFKSKTEEELSKIEAMEATIMKKAVGAFRRVSASPEFHEIERLRSKARHDEAQALDNAASREREKWQGVVAEKEATIADKDAELANLDAIIKELKAIIQ
jgi:predicted transposase/invertase (TIGR01784 family)